MTISHVAVVIPINDEELLLGECLEAVRLAIRNYRSTWPTATVQVVAVLDACTDGSARILDGWPTVDVVTVDHQNVGLARAAGIRHAISTSGRDTTDMWIANTDADSRVPEAWLLEHLRHAENGFDLVVGGIRPAPRDLSDDQFSSWADRDATARGLPMDPSRIHGANLGIRAAVYTAVGGFLPLTVGEDVDLVSRVRRSGARHVATARARVETSARTVGRMSGGYADFVKLHY